MYPGHFAVRSPDKPAVIMSDTGARLSYAELDERSIRLARVLRAAGLNPGDDVAILSENSPRCYEVYWAALRSGLYITAVNTHLQPAEVAYVVRDCGAKALVVSAGQAAVASALLELTPAVICRLAFGGTVPGHDSYEAALAEVTADPLPEQPRGREMLYSSGTTGRPKGIKAPLPGVQVDEAPDELLALFGPRFGFDAETVYLSPAPLYHAAPLRNGGLVHAVGGTVIIMPKFDAVAALAAIENYKVTHSQWVPTMFIRMLKLPDEQRLAYDLSSQQVAIHAAAPCPPLVKRAMIDWWGPILIEYYASTEALGITIIDSPDWLRKPGSVGRAELGTLRICADSGEELPVGQAGLIYFERDKLPFSYQNDPDKTASVRHPRHPNWGTAGDLGYCDDDGYLYLTDRRDFTIISGGVNIYPQEIEDALALHPEVADVAVIGVPDPDLGEQVKAFVQPAANTSAGLGLETRLITFLRDRIAHYKVPRIVEFVATLPRTETGKLQKRLLATMDLANVADRQPTKAERQ